jgi:hypothetical protein
MRRPLLASIALVAVFHLVGSSALMVTSFSVVMRRSFQRDFENYVPPRAVQAREAWLPTAADVLWSPVAGCADPGGCVGLGRLLPGGWSWLILPLNSLVWGAAVALAHRGSFRLRDTIRTSRALGRKL